MSENQLHTGTFIPRSALAREETLVGLETRDSILRVRARKITLRSSVSVEGSGNSRLILLRGNRTEQKMPREET